MIACACLQLKHLYTMYTAIAYSDIVLQLCITSDRGLFLMCCIAHYLDSSRGEHREARTVNHWQMEYVPSVMVFEGDVCTFLQYVHGRFEGVVWGG